MFIVFMCKIVKISKKYSINCFLHEKNYEEKKTLYKHIKIMINLYYKI